MNLEDFCDLVEANIRWFRGVHPESVSTLDAAERTLGVGLPASLRWLLGSLGYSAPCGLGSLSDAVELTLRCRSALGLPARFLVLNDWGDAGVVVLETFPGADPEDWPVLWMGEHNLQRIAKGEPLSPDCDRFEGYGEWVRSRLEEAIDEEAETVP